MIDAVHLPYGCSVCPLFSINLSFFLDPDRYGLRSGRLDPKQNGQAQEKLT